MAKMAWRTVIAALAITIAITGLSCGSCPFPFITSISPTSAIAGGNSFLLTVNGDDFRHNSVVNWNGSFLVTNFVSTHQLQAVVSPANIAQHGAVAVFVFSPAEGGTAFVSNGFGVISIFSCGGGGSNAVFFTVNL